MYKYDINEVMDEIKGMTIREKNKFLEKLNDELYEFASNVDDLRESINDEHCGSTEKKMSESIKSLLAEKHWEDKVEFDGTGYLLKRNGSLQSWITLCFNQCGLVGEEQSWSISVTTNLSIIEKSFPDLVNKLGIINQSGKASISIPADETVLLPTLKRIIFAWCAEEYGDAGNVTDEKLFAM